MARPLILVNLLLLCVLFKDISTEDVVLEEEVSKETCEPKLLSSSKHHIIEPKYSPILDLFVCPGVTQAPRHIFIDVHLDINLTDIKLYQLYQGPNCSTVQDEYDSDHRLFGLLKSVNLWRSMQLNPFTRTIVGISTQEEYSIGLIVNPISAWRILLFTFAIILYLGSPWLVRNALVFYASGCTTGALLSALFLVFILYRVAPKKTIGIPILIGGWSAAAWMAMHAWNNFSTIIVQYQKFIGAYFVTAMLISFAYCYRKGPPTDVRSLDIATWFFQMISCLLIYFSSQIPWISYSIIGILLSSSALFSDPSKRLFSSIYAIWTYFFPRPRRLLTEEEYQKEAVDYTEQELARLRDYCRSPEADKWKLAYKVSTPRKLARFVDGEGNHVSMREERDFLRFNEEEFYEPDSNEEPEEEDTSVSRRRSSHREPRNRNDSNDSSPSPSTQRNSSFYTPRRTAPSSSTIHTSRISTVPRSTVVHPSSSSSTVTSRNLISSRLPSSSNRHSIRKPSAYNREYYSSDDDIERD